MLNLLFILLMAIVVASNFYIFRFQKSVEGNDERGKLIQLQTFSSMYNTLFVSSVLVIVLNIVDIINAEQMVDVWLYLLVAISVFGAFKLNRNKNKQV
ncbi:hypothetical protein [Jeotgalibacillus terrae]|uniref:YtpI-like protein n=1 Tax=Jeotgalibacillus terrae TaxID=587735 RepID=A0ABW5ZHD7_9BACL|nr:hypothetical protein [Jeotgalibacillus terrae]MBM7580799.1 Sec-independent protein secretion pathway component TatC [Jeotgalibacillus terrae]